MDFSQLGTAAAESDDLTVNSAGFTREVPRAGVAFLRLREYIETGKHESPNPAYKAALKTILIFELSHPDHLIEIDGKKVPQSLFVRLNKGATNKSGYKKLFNCMNRACGGGMVHFAQMIGKSFLGEIYHNPNPKDEKNPYANIDLDGAWSLKAPVQHDVINNVETKIPVPELDGTARCFLWENESITDEDITTCWESLFIEGEREVEDAKTKEKSMKSKNWIQELIMSNIEWEGSRTQALTQEHVTLDDLESEPNQLDALAQGASPSLDD